MTVATVLLNIVTVKYHRPLPVYGDRDRAAAVVVTVAPNSPLIRPRARPFIVKLGLSVESESFSCHVILEKGISKDRCTFELE